MKRGRPSSFRRDVQRTRDGRPIEPPRKRARLRTSVSTLSLGARSSHPPSPSRSRLLSAMHGPHPLSPFAIPPRPPTIRFASLLAQRQRLPLWQAIPSLDALLQEHKIILLVGATGSGKTTQVPQCLLYRNFFLLDMKTSSRPILCTQPRRVAAMSVAERVASEADVEVGTVVGFSVRFYDRFVPGLTKIKYATDGMFLRELMSFRNTSLNANTGAMVNLGLADQLVCRRYSAVVLDEVHERTVNTDILLGILKEELGKMEVVRNQVLNAQRIRAERGVVSVLQDAEDRILLSDIDRFRVVVMSATLEEGSFQQFFRTAPVLKIPGRLYPVDILYTPRPIEDYFDASIRSVLQIHFCEKEGDILLFLTGENEIHEACGRLSQEFQKMMLQFRGRSSGCLELVCFPLHASLPHEEQARVFPKLPPGQRKCVIATNIAETSLTIDGIVYVVDPGFVKQKTYHPSVRIESLLVTEISKASADQRAGRAGRTRPGKCFRLYTESSFRRDLKDHTVPEIMRSNLSSVVLTLKKLRVENLLAFDFMSPPAPQTLIRALEELHYLGALDESSNLTATGDLMSEFPLDPRLSKAVISASPLSCFHEICTIASLLSVPGIFLRPRGCEEEADGSKLQFAHEKGDHLSLLNVFHAFVKNGSSRGWCIENYVSYRAISMAAKIRAQIVSIGERLGLELSCGDFSSSEYYDNILRALLSGFFMQVAIFKPKPGGQGGGVYVTMKEEQPVLIHPSSCCRNRHTGWVCFFEFVLTTRNFIRTVSEIQPSWLFQVAPEYYDLEANFEEENFSKRMLQRVFVRVLRKRRKKMKKKKAELL